MRRPVVLAALLTVGLMGVSPTAPGTPGREEIRAVGSCTPAWRTIQSPKVKEGRLEAVAALSATDAWAVGSVVRWVDASEDSSAPPLIEHWDGKRWSVVPAPGGVGGLHDLTIVSRSDAWAVGHSGAYARANRLLLHWDGTRWSRVTLPASVRDMTAISAIGSNDVWGVGGVWTGKRYVADISHWDGKQWTRVLSRDDVLLDDVTATSAHDVWAVGESKDRPLAMHWNGTVWQSFVLKLGSLYDQGWLSAVAGLTPNDVWAGGAFHWDSMSPPAIDGQLFHWNGKRWAEVTGFGGGTDFAAIAPISADEMWAVTNNPYNGIPDESRGVAVVHHVGGRWKAKSLPDGWELNDLVAVPTRGTAGLALWAVGEIGTGQDASYFVPAHRVPLIRRYGC